jgi:hypothetical protein
MATVELAIRLPLQAAVELPYPYGATSELGILHHRAKN